MCWKLGLVLVLLAGSTVCEESSPNVTSRIINGAQAWPGEFPETVSIRKLVGSHFCGGAIIGRNWVLTAAHCVIRSVKYSEKYYDIVVVAGEVELLPFNKSRQAVNVTEVLIHRNYDRRTQACDIALLQVEPCFRFDSDYVAPIKLVNFRVKDYEWCVALGWGRRVANVPGSKLLRFTDLIHLSIAECKKRSGFTIPKGFVCAGDLKGRTSICYGDSGTGLIYRDYLVGLASFTKQPCGKITVGAFTDVFYFRFWILNTMKKHDKRCPVNTNRSSLSKLVSGSDQSKSSLLLVILSFILKDIL